MKKLALTIISLFMMGWAMAQTGNHWSPIGGTQYNMTVKGIIVIDGVTQTSNQLEIGAFCGEECRGSRKAALFPPTGEYPVMLTVVSNVYSGETITFRIYDHATQQELNLTSESTLTFEHNTNQGSMGNWYPFNFISPSQTFNLPITGYGTSTGGYYLIAPPIDNVDPAEIEGMTTGDFDLYYFDQAQDLEWVNYKANPFNLESGKGYLYAHKTDVTLTFTGIPYSGNGQVTLSKTAGAEFEGWNLVGNPFAEAATIDRDCYVMKADGTEIIAISNRTVNPMQGVFVIAASDNETMTFVPQSATDESARIVLDVSKNRAGIIDRAIVRFDGNSTLPKFMLNPNSTKVYIPQEGMDYAVVNVGRDVACSVSTDVNFKAKENGNYTLSIDIVNLDMDYLHLIDNKTDADIDLLQTPNYTFEARTTDYAERFKLVYATTTNINEADKPFAYFADGEIRLAVETFPETSLQIVDIMGRVVVSFGDVSGNVSTQGIAPGVYVLRLINETGVKTQKIVIQ